MLAHMDGPSAFGRVTLVSGPESLLAERAIARLAGAALLERPGASVVTLDAATLDAGALAEATGGSLFASDQVVVIEGLDNLSPELVETVVSLASTPVEDLALALVHPGGVKGKSLLDRLKKLGVETVDCPTVKAWKSCA